MTGRDASEGKGLTMGGLSWGKGSEGRGEELEL